MTPPHKAHKLRDRLIEEIEATIGRPLVQHSARPIDPRKSDPLPPNLYKWQFSPEYKDFPDSSGGITKWHVDQIYACYEALDKKHLTVVSVEPRSFGSMEASERGSAPSSNNGEGTNETIPAAKENLRALSSTGATAARSSVESRIRTINHRSDPSLVDGAIESEIEQAQPTLRDDTEKAHDQGSDHRALLKTLGDFQTDMIQKMLDLALKNQAAELKKEWSARHASTDSELRVKLDKLQAKLHEEVEAHQQSINKLTGALEQNEIQRLRLVQSDKDLADKLLSARTEERQQSRDEILKDLENTMEGERRALRRNYLDQLDKVRAESYQLGLVAGKNVPSHSDTAVPDVRDKHLDIQSLKGNHEEDLRSARQVGGENAFTKPAFDSDERVNNPVKNDSKVNSNQKIQEVRTILQNWQGTHQRALPSYILLEGHTPGDKTFYPLAKQSKELDASTASARAGVKTMSSPQKTPKPGHETPESTRRDPNRCKTNTVDVVIPRIQGNQPAVGNGRPSVEIIGSSGSVVFVDSRKRSSSAVKDDDLSRDEDLYGASPPLRKKKR